MDRQTLLQLYADNGYTVTELDPSSIVVVEPSKERLENAHLLNPLRPRLENHLKEYHIEREALRKTTLDERVKELECIDSDVGCLLTDGRLMRNKLSEEDPHYWMLLQMTKIPETEKYILLDPWMMHWVFAHHLIEQQIPSIVYQGDQPHIEYHLVEGRFRRMSMFDLNFDDPTKPFDGKKLIDEFVAHYRKGEILFDFENLDKI